MRKSQNPLYSIYNKKLLEQSEIAGCYYCCSIYKTTEIIDYIDEGQTAVCPHCNVDAVLPSIIFEITEKFLQEGQDYWF